MEKIDQSMFEFVDTSDVEKEQTGSKTLTFWQDARVRFKKNKAAVISLILFCILVVIALCSPFLGTYYKEFYNSSACENQAVEGGEISSNCSLDSNLIGARNVLENQLLPPKVPVLEFFGIADGVKNGVDVYQEAGLDDSTYFLFGTDNLGRDVFVRTMVGALISILFGLTAAIIDLVIGVTLGGISGYYGGKIDLYLQRFVEIIGSVPRLIWVIILVTVIGSGFIPLMVALVISGWIPMYRMVRSQMLKLREQEYVLSARTLGASDFQIITKHLLPNAMGVIIIWLMFSIPEAIFFESFMSFLGLGISTPIPSLGSLASEGREHMQNNPYLLFIPATILSAIMLWFNLIADGLRDALDPKMRCGK